MSATLTDQIFAALAEFSSASRLYELKIGESEETGLLVEAFVADEAVQEVGARDVIALSTEASLELDALLGQPAALEICLADGARERFAGEISEAAMLGSDGGLARYRLRISPWLWRLGQVRNCRVWQDKSVVEIVDAVFEAYQPLARWRWSDDVGSFLDEVSPRSYCCQYRESDLDFVRWLLAEEGLCWRFEQTDDGPGLVLFADSSQLCAVPEDASSAALGGVRFHGARSVEESDSIQALVAQRSLHASLTTLLSYDYKAKQAVAASSPSHFTFGKLPVLESYEVPGQYAYPDWRQAQHYADLRMQAQESRGQMWHGRSSVRTLRAGTCVSVIGAPLQQLGESAPFTVLRVLSIGVNNMPPPAQHALAELFGPIPELLKDLARADMPEDLALAIGQALKTGYANCFSAVASDLVWRPRIESSDDTAYPKPVACGAQSAIVVGADGNDQPSGADELYCDRLGRVRIRFHWQDGGNASCWVRVAQRSAGGGMGQQFLPRIGQEVLVQFLENDIDRPVIVGALYNGQGEGGVVATPGGRRNSEADLSCFEGAHDHSSSGQGNLSGGNSPVWHGASIDSAGHRNPTSQWGIRSKEFGGFGYSQLLFDDIDSQGRVQLKSTHAGSELSLGRLFHASDNYRGSCRGLGAELRTDAYGSVRTSAGALIISYKINHCTAMRNIIGENTVGIGLLTTAANLVASFSAVAIEHETVGLAAHMGATQANTSELDDKAAPLKAVLNALSGMVEVGSFEAARSDATERNTSKSESRVQHMVDPVIAIAAQAGFNASAGANIQIVNGESLALMSGQDVQLVNGHEMRMHSAQAVGALAGAIKEGEGSVGLQVIAAKGAVELQTQADELKVQARDEVKCFSISGYIDFATKKAITLSTAGGATIKIDGGNVMVLCPGKITAHASKKSLQQPARIPYSLPGLPMSICVECLIKARDAGSPFAMRSV